MPIVRVDSSGNKKRKKDAKSVTIACLAASVGCCLLYFFHSPEAGIFAGIWPVTIMTALNLIDD
jgi:hypothetical protein